MTSRTGHALLTAFILGVTPTAWAAEPHVAKDRLLAPLPPNLVKHQTAAGLLSCAPRLCRTTAQPAPLGGEGPLASEHTFRLLPGARPWQLHCSEGSSSDPLCRFDEREIAGEAFYVLGDGCLYVRQLSNAYFPLTKKYCPDRGGRLERVRQHLYRVELAATADSDGPLRPARDSTATSDVLRKGASFTVVAAEVDETDDFTARVLSYFVRDKSGKTGWADPSTVGNEQCTPFNKIAVCFHGD